MTIRWPKSLPDYRWPPKFQSRRFAPVRWALAGVFHGAYAAGLLASLVRPRRQAVLVIRTDGLGDALLFEPAVENLARTLSPRVIHLWAPALTCQYLRHCPTIQRLVTIPRGFKSGNLKYFRSPFWRAKLGFMLGHRIFDKVIYPVESPEPLGNWLFSSARATERWLNYGDTTNQFEEQQESTHKIATRIIESRPGNAHELTRNEYLVQQWSSEKSLRMPKVYIPEPLMAHAERQVDGWRSGMRKAGAGELIGVMPGSSMSIKSYPAEKWAMALERLWMQERVAAVLMGGESDQTELDRVAAKLIAREVPHVRMPTPIGILQTSALLPHLDGLLSVDTGLAHAAVAQRVPTVVLVTGGNPGRFFPWPGMRNHVVLNVATPCAGCHDRCTLSQAECITQITPEEIVAGYLRLKGRKIELELYVARNKSYQAAG